MILPDNPIQNSNEDKLRRFPLAQKVAEIISKYEGNESFVIGIEGVWGSGKSSFVNLVHNQLKGNNNIHFIYFNPWNFSGQNELITDFFNTLIKEIEKVSSDISRIQKIKSVVSKLIRKSEIVINPEISFLGLVNIKGNNPFTLSNNDNTLEGDRKEIDELFRQLNKKFVIVIDDIDRLDIEETKLIMKLVKMTANFPNTVFLLCYDREKVSERLNTDGIGSEYLKKIIQVPFNLPAPDEMEIRNILFSDLENTIKSIYGEVKLEGKNESRWAELLAKGLLHPFKTIRDIKRYISSLRLDLSVVNKEDINIIDFLAIEIIRIFYPTLYSGIASNQFLFCGSNNFAISRTESHNRSKEKLKELIASEHTEIQKYLYDICEILFPHLKSESWGSARDIEWAKEKRVCHPERFRFYFQLGIPIGAISEIEVDDLATTFEDEVEFSDRIIKLSESKRIREMLKKIYLRVDRFNINQTKTVISSIWKNFNEIKDDRRQFFDLDNVEYQISRIAYDSIMALPSESRFETLKEICLKSPNLFPVIEFNSRIIDEHSTDSNNGKPTLLSKDEATEIKNLCIELIQNFAQNGSLANENNLSFILYRWKEWQGYDKVKEYIKNLTSTQEGLILFIRSFIGQVLSTGGDYLTLKKEDINNIYPIEEIEMLVSRIDDDVFNLLNENDQETIKIFRNPPNPRNRNI